MSDAHTAAFGPRRVGDLGYELGTDLQQPTPAPEDLEEFGDHALVVQRRAEASSSTAVQRLASIGELTLTLARRDHLPSVSERRTVSVDPVLCKKRGAGEERIGIDSAICTKAFLRDAPVGAAPVAVDKTPPIAPAPSLRAGTASRTMDGTRRFLVEEGGPEGGRPITGSLDEVLDLVGIRSARALPIAGNSASPPLRVAVLDWSFAGAEVLRVELAAVGVTLDPPSFHGLPRQRAPSSQVGSPGHGTMAAGVVLGALRGASAAPLVDVGMFRYTPREGCLPNAFLDTADISLSIAAAVEEWKADLVILAVSDGDWGTPGHLRAVLREATRSGRQGLGTAIFCSVGAPDRNLAGRSGGETAALGTDELASQPWVFAVSATDAVGRWYRNYSGARPFHRPSTRARAPTYNRFGPALSLSAPGEKYILSEELGVVDDSSLASVLASCAAALCLRQNRQLRLDELREILEITADVPPIVDDGPGLGAGDHDEFDGSGRNFKLGAGRVNALAAALAAADPVCLALLLSRPRPGPIPGAYTVDFEPALCAARRWNQTILGLCADGSLAAERYVTHRGRLVKLALGSRPARDALTYIARHLMAVLSSDSGAAWSRAGQNHGALLQRLVHAADALADAALAAPSVAPPEEHAALLSWLAEAGAWLAGLVDHPKVGDFVYEALVGER